MKTSYNFSIIRYVHDVIGGEFINVGVILYAPDSEYLATICTNKYGRLSKLFINVDGEHFRSIMNHFENKIEEFKRQLESNLGFDQKPRDVLEIARQILPEDDSSLQFSSIRGGLTENLPSKLTELYERYVEKYTDKIRRPKREDDDVWKIFKGRLEEKRIIKYIQPHTIVTPNYEHEFKHTWKNKQWRALEALSFDLEDSSSISEKAVKWLGRANALEDSEEKFRLYFLLGSPQDTRLQPAYVKAENIMNKMTVPHEFVHEREADKFADEVKVQILEHLKESSI